jgi:hypothetical protein
MPGGGDGELLFEAKRGSVIRLDKELTSRRQRLNPALLGLAAIAAILLGSPAAADARALMDLMLRLMIKAVHRYDGYVAQSTGDGIFVLFGAPIAHEDHARRALYAIAMQQELRLYGQGLKSQGRSPVEVRIRTLVKPSDDVRPSSSRGCGRRSGCRREPPGDSIRG